LPTTAKPFVLLDVFLLFGQQGPLLLRDKLRSSELGEKDELWVP
jgi:hypothetical protein